MPKKTNNSTNTSQKVEQLIELANSLKDDLSVLNTNQLSQTVDGLEESLSELKDEVNEMRYCLMKQNATILSLIQSNSVAEVETQSIEQISKSFPLDNQQDLADLENILLDDRNKQAVVAAIRDLLIPHGIAKNIHYVLSPQLILKFNIMGAMKKKRLLDYTKFMDALFDAAYVNGYNHSKFLDDIRYGFKLVKKRKWGKSYRNRKIESQQEIAVEDTSDVDISLVKQEMQIEDDTESLLGVGKDVSYEDESENDVDPNDANWSP